MRTLNTKTLKPVQLTALAILLAFESKAFAASYSDHNTIMGWQSSLATEFVKLDTSGNGLLLPLEASKGNAFSKKTFAAADVDGDGTIDQNEYINYRVSMGAKDIPANIIVSAPDSNENKQTNNQSSVSDESVTNNIVADNSTKMSEDSAEPRERTVGNVIDDSVITTKAKAAIFNTPDLKTLQISVETRKGEVLLSGFVDNEAAKMRAEEVVKNVVGVKSVKNSLEVKG